MKIYLAGPMRGYPLFNFPAFDVEAARLRKLGHTVFSPAERDRQDGFDPAVSKAETIDHYMAIDLPEVCRADAVVVLPGWEKSQGCNIEVAVGAEVGKKILHSGDLFPVIQTLPSILKVTGTVGKAAEICTTGTAKELLHKIQPAAPNALRLGYKFCKASGCLTQISYIGPDLCPKHGLRIETIPDDANPKDLLGLKKVALRLVPPALTIFVAKVMALGAKKYGPYNWRNKKIRHTVYLEAAMRHILSALDGEETDPESGMPHEAHAAACMGIILDAKSLDILINDRPLPGAAAKLIAQFTEKV